MPTKIEWIEETWNPIVGCSRIDKETGCRNCYAVRMARRQMKTAKYKGLTYRDDAGTDLFYPNWTGEVRFVESEFEKPLRWRKPRTIFVCSMGDLFHDSVDGDWLNAVLDVVRQCPQHQFVMLTKREVNMRARMEAAWVVRAYSGQVLPNLALGVSCSTQEELDRRVPVLLDTPAACRFVSLEPCLAEVNVVPYCGGSTYRCECGWHETERELFVSGGEALCMECQRKATIFPSLDGIIVGGETGPGARPMHPDNVRSVRDQCAEAGVSFFFKGFGEYAWQYMPTSHNGTPTSNSFDFVRVGKKNTGRTLDGRTHDDLPWRCHTP